ncbi:hypothetical protein Adt_09562 [Abeliophyllum distichum]|uniref:Ribosomal protein L2 n=1 Tax=Abeliophyllum distichum TaxID=126358 RepID=A0ABD1UJ52_9LAMI
MLASSNCFVNAFFVAETDRPNNGESPARGFLLTAKGQLRRGFSVQSRRVDFAKGSYPRTCEPAMEIRRRGFSVFASVFRSREGQSRRKRRAVAKDSYPPTNSPATGFLWRSLGWFFRAKNRTRFGRFGVVIYVGWVPKGGGGRNQLTNNQRG